MKQKERERLEQSGIWLESKFKLIKSKAETISVSDSESDTVNHLSKRLLLKISKLERDSLVRELNRRTGQKLIRKYLKVFLDAADAKVSIIYRRILKKILKENGLPGTQVFRYLDRFLPS